MSERRFRTLPLRDNLRNSGIRLGHQTVYIDADGQTGPVDPHTAQSIEHMGGFAEVFDFGPPPVDLADADAVARALEASADTQAPADSSAAGKRRKKGES